MTDSLYIRLAAGRDLDGLVALEERCFTGDRFNEDQIAYLLEEAHATIYVITSRDRIVAAAYMLWRRNSPVGRLYNIAVDPDVQGHGLGQRLLDRCEEEAVWRACTSVSLEVREDNRGAIALYERNGFARTAGLPGYYEDGGAGVRMVKELTRVRPDHLRLKVPYEAQTLDFTCGPACVMMALRYFDPELDTSRVMELELWREATLIFMTSGHGGTGPFGLALSAVSRGRSARVLLSRNQTPFFSSVRDEDKRRVIKLVHEDLRDRAHELGVPYHYYDFPFADIAVELFRGHIPIALISTYHLHGDRAPHWVVITGFDREFVYFHDPFNEFYEEQGASPRNVKIPLDLFSRMRRYGRDLYKCVIAVGPGPREGTRLPSKQ